MVKARFEESPFLVDHDYYEITITPEDKYQFNGKGDTRLHNFCVVMDELLKHALTDLRYVLYTDISFPHVNVNKKSGQPRLHMHGIIYVNKHISKFWLSGMYKLSRWANVSVNIPEPDTKDQWLKYCKKAVSFLSNQLNKKHLRFTPLSPVKKPI